MDVDIETGRHGMNMQDMPTGDLAAIREMGQQLALVDEWNPGDDWEWWEMPQFEPRMLDMADRWEAEYGDDDGNVELDGEKIHPSMAIALAIEGEAARARKGNTGG